MPTLIYACFSLLSGEIYGYRLVGVVETIYRLNIYWVDCKGEAKPHLIIERQREGLYHLCLYKSGIHSNTSLFDRVVIIKLTLSIGE